MIDVGRINAAYPAPNPPMTNHQIFANKKDMLTVYVFCSVSRTLKTHLIMSSIPKKCEEQCDVPFWKWDI
jgi:hypothetical protein